jgi:hypothetical protein
MGTGPSRPANAEVGGIRYIEVPRAVNRQALMRPNGSELTAGGRAAIAGALPAPWR